MTRDEREIESKEAARDDMRRANSRVDPNTGFTEDEYWDDEPEDEEVSDELSD